MAVYGTAQADHLGLEPWASRSSVEIMRLDTI
jgi:hypothetical protein